MARRSRIPRKRSRKMFTRTAKRVNRRNNTQPMRGGIRL